MIDRMVRLPEPDQHVLQVLRELRAGLYQSDCSERLGEPAKPHRDRCVINAATMKDRDARRRDEQVQVELGRTGRCRRPAQRRLLASV